jgi:ribosomal protein S21
MAPLPIAAGRRPRPLKSRLRRPLRRKQVRRKLFVGRRIEVEEGETIDRALWRLKVSLSYEYKCWTKKRYGYYEKPSALRRKKEKMARLCQIRWGPRKGQNSRARMHLFIGLKALTARTGPINSVGH